jgi:hypothetical protein
MRAGDYTGEAAEKVARTVVQGIADVLALTDRLEANCPACSPSTGRLCAALGDLVAAAKAEK